MTTPTDQTPPEWLMDILQAVERHGYNQAVKSLGGFRLTAGEVPQKAAQAIWTKHLEVVREAENVVTDLMKEFANTKLGERGTGWDWLVKAKQRIATLHSGSKGETTNGN